MTDLIRRLLALFLGRGPESEPDDGLGPGNDRTTPEALAAINRLRARPLRWDRRVALACLDHSSDMASRRFFSHAGSDGSEFPDRVRRRAGDVAALRECIGWGYPDASVAVDAWSQSAAGHKFALVDPEARSVGVAVAYALDGEPYWTLVTAR